MTTQNGHYNKIIRNITQTKLAVVTCTVTDSQHVRVCRLQCIYTLHYNVWIFRLDLTTVHAVVKITYR